MDFALSSSTVLGAAVLLWLLWVAPYLLRRFRPARVAGEAALLMESEVETAEAAAAPAAPSAVSEAPPVPAPSPVSAPSPASEPPLTSEKAAAQSAPAPLKIRWGRTAVAGLGALGLLTAVVSGLLVVFGGSVIVPLVGAAVAVCSVAVLRALAVRDRRRRLDTAFREAMSRTEQTPLPPLRPAGPSEVFDAGRYPLPAPRQLSREELRAAALEVARASQASADAEAKASGEPMGSTWEPTEVPKPGYIEAARAERPAPEPLEVPADPKPAAKTQLKPKAEAPEPGTVPGVPALAPKGSGRGVAALGNLDAVLQRRRA